MKKLILVLLLAAPLSLLAQGLNIRHVKGIRSVDLLGGQTRYGQVFSLGYVRYMSKTMYWKGSGFYEMGKGNGVNYTSAGAEFFFARTITQSGYKYYLNVIGGAHLSVDNINSGFDNVKINSSFKSGVLLGLENEIFITDRFVFIVSGSQRALLGQDFGNYRWFLQGGIRYNF